MDQSFVETQTSVQLFAIIHLTTIGVSHVVAHRGWAEFFILLRKKGPAGVFVVGFLSLGFGSIVAAFHPVWTGPAIVLTLFGWSQVLKGLLYFSFPAYGLRKLELVSIERSRLFMIPGAGLLMIAGLLLWIVLTG
ncbi:MAG: hypothetical protein OEO79_08525 [Gemmatimonadota bacterium]|nr:hypothetical protein [Gemmatimonadota bacterium]